ncbi:hypothetical protein [Microbacterium sp. NPDC055665]
MTNLSTYEIAEDTTSPGTPAPRWKRWLIAAACGAAIAAVAVVLVVLHVERQSAVEAFEAAAADRVAVYDAQGEAVEQLHAAEAALTDDYPSLLAIASTLTDSTVADPATRADLLSKVTAYAETDLALDESGVFIVDRPALHDALKRERKVSAEARPVSEFTAEELRSQAAVLASDTKKTRSHIDLVQKATTRIMEAAVAAADSADAVIASAAEKGATLSWAKAPAETAAVVATAAALTTDDAQSLPLADRAGLVSAYIAAVKAAGAAHQAVIDREAEAARRAAAEEAERQAAAQRQQQQQNSNGGGGNPSSRGSNGGGSPSTGGGSPGGGMGAPRNTSSCGCLGDKNVWE